MSETRRPAGLTEARRTPLFTYEIDAIEIHRHLHDRDPFTPELLDRWLEIFRDTFDSGWTGPSATSAKKRATGMTWVMAHRFLGKGIWKPEERRT